MYVIMVYDISLEKKEGQKVLRKVFQTSKRFLNHIQHSVFEGNLTDAQYLELKMEVTGWIREEVDSVIFFHSSSEKWLDKEIVGLAKNTCSNLL